LGSLTSGTVATLIRKSPALSSIEINDIKGIDTREAAVEFIQLLGRSHSGWNREIEINLHDANIDWDNGRYLFSLRAVRLALKDLKEANGFEIKFTYGP